MVKTDSPNYYKPPTRFTVLKTDYTNFLYALWCFTRTSLRWLKRSLRTSTSLLPAVQTSKQTLRTSASLQHAFLQFKRNLRNFPSSPVVKTDCPQLYNHRTLFVILKTDNQNSTNPVPFLRGSKRNLPTFYTHPTRFAVVKMNSPNSGARDTDSRSLLHALRCSKTISHHFYKPPIRFAVLKSD